MTILDALAWLLMATALLRSLRPARDEHEQSLKLEHWLVAVMLNGTALALWNLGAGPLAACQHWLSALGVLLALRFAMQAVRQHAPALRQRALPMASTVLGLLWIHVLRT